MNRKTMYCTIDTETVGGAATPTGMYNIGCSIHDREGNIVATVSLLVMEHFDKIRYDDYAKKNFHLYEQGLLNGSMSAVATEAEAISIVRNLCRFYGVRYVMAFNSSFDFVKTICRELLDEFEFIDLYLVALQTITHKKSYADFCRANGYRSKSGTSCATSAEALYAYVSNNPNYIEEHTALADTFIEVEIFSACVKMHKAYTKNIHCYDCKGKNAHKSFPKWEA